MIHDLFDTGCLICGAPLVYLDTGEERVCSLCDRPAVADASCESGHFVCDHCHRSGALELIQRVCASTEETDMLALVDKIRAHPSFSVHGPEHHALVPAVMLATWRNLGGEVSDEDLRTAIVRGSVIPGGFCGRVGLCGAAAGVGVGFGIFTRSTPLEPAKRQALLAAMSRVLADLAEREGARCCQRETYLALQQAARISQDLLDPPLRAEGPAVCHQHHKNRQCIGEACPYHPSVPQPSS